MAETLTADQANQLARWYSNLADAIGDYRTINWNILSGAQRERIGTAEDDIRNASTDMVELALRLRLEDLTATLVRIKAATDQMKNAIRHLQNVAKAIAIVTAAVTLAGAIVEMNPAAILEGVNGAIAAATGE